MHIVLVGDQSGLGIPRPITSINNLPLRQKKGNNGQPNATQHQIDVLHPSVENVHDLHAGDRDLLPGSVSQLCGDLRIAGNL